MKKFSRLKKPSTRPCRAFLALRMPESENPYTRRIAPAYVLEFADGSCEAVYSPYDEVDDVYSYMIMHTGIAWAYESRRALLSEYGLREESLDYHHGAQTLWELDRWARKNKATFADNFQERWALAAAVTADEAYSAAITFLQTGMDDDAYARGANDFATFVSLAVLHVRRARSALKRAFDAAWPLDEVGAA